MTITAPFRFARINRKVYFPDWADRVSHDVPFEDGLSGTIALSITTQTPLLVGGKRKKENGPDNPATVYPFKDGSGNWAIPGSSIQGVIRQMLEVAAFGKLGPMVHDRRFGVRDISPGPTADSIYRGRLVNRVQTGWLIRGEDTHGIVPCDMERIEIAELMRRFPAAKITLEGQNDAKVRLEALTGRASNRDYSRLQTQLSGHSATLVITGKTNQGIADRDNKKNPKKCEFVFFNKSRQELMKSDTVVEGKDVEPDVWRDFLLIHDPEKGTGSSINPNWEFWKPEFLAGQPVPVFYIEEAGKVSALGMAHMFKLAMALSTHQMLEHSSKDHMNRTRFDLPSLIFGASGGEGQKDSWFSHNLKRRATFDLFRAEDPGVGGECETNWQVLLTPKPSYYPIYVRQNGRPNGQRPYAAYHGMAGQNDAALGSPELAGTKLWPVRGNAEPQNNHATQSEIRKVANHLRSVPAGQCFSGTMRVHNLRPAELGALLWALTFGGLGGTHRLGGAKPLGFGEVKIEIAGIELFANDGTVPDQAALIAAFVKEMNAFHGDTWEQSPQVRALLKAASTGTQELAYLNGHKGYADARRENQIMDGYADSDAELSRDLEELRKVAAEANRKRVEAEKQAKSEILAASPHLAYAQLVDAKFPNRHAPPEQFEGHPPTDAFAIGDRVMLHGNVEGIIVAYPAMRSHPAEIKKTKWGVGYVNAGGTMIVEERKQADIAKAE